MPSRKMLYTPLACEAELAAKGSFIHELDADINDASLK